MPQFPPALPLVMYFGVFLGSVVPFIFYSTGCKFDACHAVWVGGILYGFSVVALIFVSINMYRWWAGSVMEHDPS